MTDPDDPPLTVLLTCGHVHAEGHPEPFTAHRVVPYEGSWAVKTQGSWCSALLTWAASRRV